MCDMSSVQHVKETGLICASFIHSCNMTHSRTWLIRDSFKCATCRARNMSMRHDSFVTHSNVRLVERATCSFMRHDSFNDICSCDMTHSRTRLIRDSFKRATCRACNMSHNMTRSFWILLVCHYSFIRVTCHIHMCNTNHVHVWYITHIHDSSHTRDTSRIYMIRVTCVTFHTYIWFVLHVWMCHVTNMNETSHMRHICDIQIMHVCVLSPSHGSTVSSVCVLRGGCD